MLKKRLHKIAAIQKERYQYAEQLLPRTLENLIATPLPDEECDVRDLDLLVLDFETTGLDPNKDSVLSIGWVEVIQSIIHLNKAHHLYIHHRDSIAPESVKIHHIRPEDLRSEGIPQDVAFELLFNAMVGKIIVAHGTVVERHFINEYIQQKFNVPIPPLLWFDTLQIEKYRLQMTRHKADWRLSSLRQNIGLPCYTAHHALNDALSAAELYLAQIQRLFGNEKAPLGIILEASK